MENPELVEKKSFLLKEICGAMAATDNVTVINNLMLDLAINCSKAEKGSLMLLDKRGELSIRAARGMDLEYKEKCRVRIGDGIAGTVAKHNVSALVKDIEQDTRFRRENRDRYATKSFISCPVTRKDTVIGVLNVNDKTDGSPFTDHELNLLTFLADLSAVAIEKAHLMTQVNAKAAELDGKQKELLTTDSAKADFLALASHELRTPLNAIKGAIYFLQQPDKSPGASSEEFYQIISRETNRLIQIVEDFLACAGPDNRTHLVATSRISPLALLKERASLPPPDGAMQERVTLTGLAARPILEFISELLDLSTCSIMLADRFSNELTIRHAKGLEADVVKRTKVRYGEGIAGWVALEGKSLLVEDIERDPRFGRRNLPRYNTRSLLALPLKDKNSVVGVITLNNKRKAEPFTITDLHMASALCERLSHAIQSANTDAHNEGLGRFFTSAGALLNAARMYHKKSFLPPDLILGVMDSLGAEAELKKTALYVSLIYDLGLMIIDSGILLKKDMLSPLETRMIRVHPYVTLDLIDNFEFSTDVRKAILHHHERFDGTGYPEKLGYGDIPLISRVLSVVDSYCALSAERPYRKAFSKEDALREIEKGSGSAYDPEIVDAFRETVSPRRTV